ncbi:MAG: hypothetical protein J6V40_02335 [Clostridia bacterium]|nr:hypothetical protein [Clostridia bacterium]
MKIEIEGLFISKNDIDLGSIIREDARKYNCNIMYGNSGADIINFVMNKKYGIIFFGEDCYKYYDILADFMDDSHFTNICMVFISNDVEDYIVNNNIYIVSRSNINSAMSDVVSRALILYRNMDNKLNINIMSQYLTNYLTDLGFSQKYVGFQYIKEAVLTAIEKNKNISSYNSEVYPIVALKNGTQVSNIEKSIRLSIKSASIIDNELFRECNFVNLNKISNKLFLSHVIDKVRCEMSKISEVE